MQKGEVEGDERAWFTAFGDSSVDCCCFFGGIRRGGGRVWKTHIGFGGSRGLDRLECLRLGLDWKGKQLMMVMDRRYLWQGSGYEGLALEEANFPT